MKRNYFLAATLCAALMLSSCFGSSASTGNLLSGTNTGTTTSVLTSAGTSVLGTLLTTLLGNKTTQNSIVGTWTYSAPKVAFESENILAKIGSSVASSKIESTLGNQLKKIGFQAGKTTLTFAKDGTCTMTRSGKTLNGTYSYDTNSGKMTIQGALGLASISLYVSVVGNEMYMLFDADKILSIMTSLSSATSATSTFGNLLGNYSGLKLGWTMTR